MQRRARMSLSSKKQNSPSFRQTAMRSITDPVLRGSPTLGRGPPHQIPVSTALQQCCQLIHLQDILLQSTLKHRKELIDAKRSERHGYDEMCKKLEAEKIAHAETKCLLSTEQEKAALALTEVQVLSKQLDREKSTFENAFGLLKSQALSDSTKSESLLAKCSALESLIAGKDESIARLQGQVHELTERIKEMKQTHKTELQEANIRAQQEVYLAKNLGTAETTNKRTHSSRYSRDSARYSRGRIKTKSRNIAFSTQPE